MKNVILYGTSKDCRRYRSLMNRMVEQGEIRILGRSEKERSEDDGAYPFIPFSQLQEQQADYCFLMSEKTERADREMLMNHHHLSMDQMIPFVVFTLPDMTLALYESIRSRKITILSNTCFGGYLCHRFRIECCSPFKNLWLSEAHFLKFLQNPEHYLSLKPRLRKLRRRISEYDRPVYPVLALDDIRLHCNHDINPLRAINDWNRRAAKINMDDLIVVLITDKKETEDQFYRLDYPHMYCFTGYPSEDIRSVFIPLEKGETAVNASNRFAMEGAEGFSATKLILGEKDIRI